MKIHKYQVVICYSCELPSLYSSYYKKVFPKWMNCGIFRQAWSLFGQYLQAQHLCSAFKQSSQMWDFCGNSAISAHIIREESPQWGVCSMQQITHPCQDYTANIYIQPYQCGILFHPKWRKSMNLFICQKFQQLYCVVDSGYGLGSNH